MPIRVFVDRRATVRVSFTLVDKETGEEEAEYLDLREELSAFEAQTLALAAVKNTSLDDAGRPQFVVDAANQRVLTRLAWITGWSFAAPVTADSMERLRGDVAGIIDDLVDKHAADAARRARLVRDPKRRSPTAPADSATPPGES